jgi:hypothetical protein
MARWFIPKSKLAGPPKDKQVVKHPDSEADMLFETQEACRNRGFAHLVSKWTVSGRFHVNTRTAPYFNR